MVVSTMGLSEVPRVSVRQGVLPGRGMPGKTLSKGRYNSEALWYGGYITRFWHYLTGETMKQIYAQCDENLLLQCYGFHSEANEMAVEDIKAIASAKVSKK